MTAETAANSTVASDLFEANSVSKVFSANAGSSLFFPNFCTCRSPMKIPLGTAFLSLLSECRRDSLNCFYQVFFSERTSVPTESMHILQLPVVSLRPKPGVPTATLLIVFLDEHLVRRRHSVCVPTLGLYSLTPEVLQASRIALFFSHVVHS